MKFYITNLNESKLESITFVGEVIKSLFMEVIIDDESKTLEFHKNNREKLISIFIQKIKDKGFDVYVRRTEKNIIGHNKLTLYKRDKCHCSEIGELDLIIITLKFWKIYTPGKRVPSIVLLQVDLDGKWLNYYISYHDLNSGDLIAKILNISKLVYSHVKNIVIELKNKCVVKLNDYGELIEIQGGDKYLDIIERYKKIKNPQAYLKKLLNLYHK